MADNNWYEASGDHRVTIDFDEEEGAFTLWQKVGTFRQSDEVVVELMQDAFKQVKES